MLPWEVKPAGKTQTKEELVKERVADAIVTLKSVKVVVEEAQEKCRVAWHELAEEIRALEDLRGKL